jgi:hypothetical protein
MTTTRRAAPSLGGIARTPPIDREAASLILRHDISPAAWSAIEAAFERYGDCLDDLSPPQRLSRKKDERSWPVRQEQTAKLLEKRA